jgi:hypothetical protein
VDFLDLNPLLSAGAAASEALCFASPVASSLPLLSPELEGLLPAELQPAFLGDSGGRLLVLKCIGQ